MQGGVTHRDTGLAWGIKGSFLEYVERWPESSVELAPGTGRLPDGRFYFTPDPERPDGQWWFRGGVRLRAHGGLLDVSLADPRLERGAAGPVLTAETWVEGQWRRIPFAELQWTEGEPEAEIEPASGTVSADGQVQMVTAAVRLHAEAAPVFDGTYPSGVELAALQVRL